MWLLHDGQVWKLVFVNAERICLLGALFVLSLCILRNGTEEINSLPACIRIDFRAICFPTFFFASRNFFV